MPIKSRMYKQNKVYSHNEHDTRRMNSLQLHTENIVDSRKHNVEGKKPDTKEYCSMVPCL